MQPVWLCILLCKCVEDAFQNTHWGKVLQMQPMWLCIIPCRQFDETFENTQWRKVKQMQPVWLCILCPTCFEGAFENAKTFNNDVKQCNQCDYSDYSADASSRSNQFMIHCQQKNHIGFICFVFLHGVFSNMSDRRICLTFRLTSQNFSSLKTFILLKCQ